MLNPSPDVGIDSIFEITPRVDVQASTTVAPLTLTAPTLPPPTIPTISQVPQAPTPPPTAPSTFLQDLSNFGSLFGFDHRIKTLEANFSEFVQTNQFAGAVSSIPEIIIKEQVKEQVKVQVFKILPKIEKTVNEQLEAEVLTRSSNSSKPSYAVAADLSEMELKKILIEKMESNKSIQRSDEQRNLYKSLVDAYESDKIILDTYGDTVTLKRRRDDEDKDKEPSARSDRGSKGRKERKELESTSAPKEKEIKTTGKSSQGSKSHQRTASEYAPAEEPMQTTQDLEEPSHQEFKIGAADDEPIAEAFQNPEWFQQQKKPSTPDHQLDWNNPEGQRYPHNLLKPLPLIPNSRGRRVIPFDHFINNDLKYLCGGASSRKYTTSVTKTKATDYGHIKWIKDLVVALSLLITSSTMTSSIYVAEPPVTTTSTPFGEFLTEGGNVNSSTGMRLTRSLLEMYTPRGGSSLSLNSILWNSTTTSIWIGSQKADKSNGRRTLCFQRLSKNVHNKHRHLTTCGRSSTRKSNKERVAAMIQAIDKQLKTRRIMGSLEKFV
nr:hypothetical protein [Tanacetum cinerariifolium]